MNQDILRRARVCFMHELRMNDSYKPLAKYYDLLSWWYSLGQITYCREAYLKEITEMVGENAELRVCFVGVGHGSEAIKVAQAGALVTVVDSSSSMLEVFKKNVSLVPIEVQSRVEIIHTDISKFIDQEQCPYDWVIANFFLNVFDEEKVQRGSFVIGDFYLAQGSSKFSPWLAALQKIYWFLALVIFRFWIKNAFHSVYDYRDLLSQSGYKVIEEKRFGFLGIKFYSSIRSQMLVR